MVCCVVNLYFLKSQLTDIYHFLNIVIKHISAEFYGNEAEVGKAIKSSGLKRDELFLCSKVWTTTIEKGEDAIRARLDKSELYKV